MIICGKCLAENSDKRKFCGECGSLIVSFCKKCGFHNLVADKYCGGCGISMTATAHAEATGAGEAAREESVAGRYSAADIQELTALRSDVKSTKVKKKDGADTDQMSQDAVNEIFNTRNEK